MSFLSLIAIRCNMYVCVSDASLGVEGVSAGVVSWHMALSTKH
jgi:hypothetical protein